MKLIFVSGPYRHSTEWELEENIRRAEDAAIKLWRDGWAVICPHKNTAHFGGICDDEVWLRGDIEMLKRCDAICMIEGWQKSEGAKEELRVACEMDKEVIYAG